LIALCPREVSFSPQHTAKGVAKMAITETARNTVTSAAQSARDAMSGAMESARHTASDALKAVRDADHSEGRVARAIEQQTAKLPSDTFLWAALGSMGLSLGLQLAGRKEMSNFVGQWAPTILIFGLYNKLVKLHGSESERSQSEPAF
jgi:hypothetical protein